MIGGSAELGMVESASGRSRRFNRSAASASISARDSFAAASARCWTRSGSFSSGWSMRKNVMCLIVIVLAELGHYLDVIRWALALPFVTLNHRVSHVIGEDFGL